jgi:7-cyano-7-deazaguanine synthase
MAKALCEYYSINRLEIDLMAVGQHLTSNLLKSGGAVPEGHYESDSMRLTVVPGRNMIFISILAGIAASHGGERVVVGVHSGDHAIYPDCRPQFIESMNKAVNDATDQQVELIAPFLHMSKGQILQWGLNHGVPYHLTRTCYKDQPLACGRCGACCERLEAFRLCGVSDPLMYEHSGGSL